MAILNTSLHRAIGIPFVYKTRLKAFLQAAGTGTTIVTDAYTGSDEANFTKYFNNFNLTGPSMGFSTKLYCYQALEVIIQALLRDRYTVQDTDKVLLNTRLLDVLRYVGIAGEGDFNFQVAVFKLAEVLSVILDAGYTPPVNTAPTLTLTNQVTTLAENSVIGTGIKVADINIIDDILDITRNILSLSGADAASFGIRNNNALYYIGASPDFETKASYVVNVNVNDATVGSDPDNTVIFTLTITNVVE